MSYPNVRVTYAIAHAGWRLDRRLTLKGLLAELESVSQDVYVHVSPTREPASVWARRLYVNATLRGDETTVFLNDDVRLCPGFPRVVRAVVSAVPEDQPLSFHMSARAVYPNLVRGIHLPWVKSYWMTGPAYVLRAGQPKELATWWEEAPKELQEQNEDNWGIVWSWMGRRPFWCTLPALVEHDLTIPSTSGHGAEAHRRAPFGFRDVPRTGWLSDPTFWKVSDPASVPEVECPWFPRAAREQWESRYRAHRPA